VNHFLNRALLFLVHLPEFRGMCWAAVAMGVVLAWGVATAFMPPGPGPSGARSPAAVGAAGASLLLLVLIGRAVALATDSPGGPMAWLHEQLPSQVWLPAHAVMGIAVTQAWLLLPLSALWARLLPDLPTPLRIPNADGMAAVLGLCALTAVLAGDYPYRLGGAPVMLDLAGTLPVTILCFAIATRLQVAEPPPLPAVAVAPTEAPLPPMDVPAHWKQLAALEPQARPLAATMGHQGQPGPDWAERAWHDVGAQGPAPRALEELVAAWSLPGHVYGVGDLPDPADVLFLSALALLAVRREGLPVLIISDEPQAIADRVRRGFEKTGRWNSGPLVVGVPALREALAAGKMPAAVFVEARALSHEGIRTLASEQGSGARWAERLGLILLASAEKGTPLEVTHRTFTLRRLALVLRASDARWSVVATAPGGDAGRHTLQAAFPGMVVREVAYGPRASAPVRVWAAREAFQKAPGGPWERRALQEVATRGLPAAVGDPTGTLDSGATSVWGASVRLVREATLDGVASATQLDDAWLLSAHRALKHRPPLPDGRPHDALWGLAPGGVTRFLTRGQNLEGLARSGQLPAPRPLIGHANRLVQQAHLLAALGEADQDVESLCGMFEPALVEHVAPPGDGASVLRQVRDKEGLVRAKRVPRRANAVNPIRATVTEQVLKITNAQGGALLLEVDAVLAATRFYPGRVFAVGEHRFGVPMHGLDPKRMELRVDPVSADHPLTEPVLTIRLDAAQQVQATQKVSEGRLVFQTAVFEATALEEVRGHQQAGRKVEHEPVTARYRTRTRALFFGESSPAALFHLARSLDEMLLAHLLARDEDLEVFPVQAGLAPGFGPGVAVIDRYVQGMGASEALDPQALGDVLKWVRATLQTCPCNSGCVDCTPPEVLEAGPDKAGVLKLLGA
jgi:hypothetical protein